MSKVCERCVKSQARVDVMEDILNQCQMVKKTE